jgi:hypothetical protein
MRFDPLTSREQSMFEREMLIHFGYADSHERYLAQPDASIQIVRTYKPKKGKERDLIKAQNIFNTFNAIIDNEPEQPVSFDEMVDEIRYKMGYGWLAWFLFKNFAIPIIKWLWERYHSSIPETIGAPAK